jgi:hypothetical protein
LTPEPSDAAYFAANKVAEGVTKQIKVENFVPQARKRGILKATETCDEDRNPVFEAYEDLYTYLIKKNVVKSEVGVVSLATFDSVQTINDALTSESDLKKLINKDNGDFPKKLDCYTIHHKELSDLLEHYKYSAANELNYYSGLMKKSNKKNNNNKQNKRNKQKNQTKKNTKRRRNTRRMKNRN